MKENRAHYNGDNNPEMHKYFDPHLSYGEGVIVCERSISPRLNHGLGGAYKVSYRGGVADCHPMGDPRERTRRSTNAAQQWGSSTVWGIRWWDSKPTEED